MIAGLRDYQKGAIEGAFEWMTKNKGNPCIEAPTGSGKSWIIAGICEDVIREYNYNVIVLSHVKELIEQDAEKIRLAWPDAPVGVYCAGLGEKDIKKITVASIQSIWKKAPEIKKTLGRVELVIIDEAHMINNKNQGRYRKFLDDLNAAQTGQPAARVIGLTATPYRLGQGKITDGDAIFSYILTPTSIEELVDEKYLAPLVSKVDDLGRAEQLVQGVRKDKRGEYKSGDLERVYNTEEQNNYIIENTLKYADNRKAWIVFCTGVKHAEAMRDALNDAGVSAEMVTGQTPREERDRILSNFKAGKIRAITNVNVLSTGFDYPDIDLIVMARPTLSPGLYVQMAGRGMRLKSGEYKDCAVLDFAGNIERHGAITGILPPPERKKKGKPKERKKEGESQKEKKIILHGEADIMERPEVLHPARWHWVGVTSKKGGKMLIVQFYPQSIFDRPKVIYLCVGEGYSGYPRSKGIQTMETLLNVDCDEVVETLSVEEIARRVNAKQGKYPCPLWLKLAKRPSGSGVFYSLISCGWEAEDEIKERVG